MEIVFRRFSDDESPGPHELILMPAALESCLRLDYSTIAIDKGIAAFKQGQEPLKAIVLKAVPAFDDLLGATICQELAAHRALPPGLKSFARYAGLLREGLTPGKSPPEHSLEAMFLAILNDAGDDLADPATAGRLLARWSAMAAAIWRAAEAGIDPIEKSIFADNPEFAREVAFLARDLIVYRQDLRRGEQWAVKLPGGPPEAHALFLRQPKSLLFKQWSRTEQNSHLPGTPEAGQPFLLLAVDWGRGSWIFSTDPVQRLSLESLSARLQAAEAKLNPGNAWFDGRRFNFSLIAAPGKGSQLPEQKLLEIVRDWCHARPLGQSLTWRPSRRAMLATVGSAGVAALAYGLWPRHTDDSRGLQFMRIDPSTLHDKIGPRTGKDYALLFATDDYDHWPKLKNAISDARSIGQILETQYGFVQPDEAFTLDREQILGKLRSYAADKQFHDGDQLFIYFAGHGDYDPVTKEGFIVPKDAASPEADPVVRTSRSIPLSQLKDKIEKLGCNHVFIVLDICFGGTIEFGVATEGGTRGSGVGTPVDVPKNEFINRKLKHKCRRYLASVGKEEAPDGPLQGHSPFAAQLLRSLDEDARDDGVVTIGKILTRVERGAQETRDGALLGHEPGGDFLFVHR
jgi:hypothetical protein